MNNRTHAATRQRASRLAISLIVLAGLLPFGGVASAQDGHTAERTPISFTSSTVETIDEGEVTVDDAGVFHLHGVTVRDEVAGDIEGEAVIEFDLDFQPAADCTPADEDCPGVTRIGGHIEITDADGAWEGEFVWTFSTVEGVESDFSKAILRGRDGNAGQSIVADIVDETGETVTLEGFMLTMATPHEPFNVNVQLCGADKAGIAGGFLSRGAVAGSGAATAEFIPAGARDVTGYELFGETVLTDERGSLTLHFVGHGQDGSSPDTGLYGAGWGHFVIVDGTGAYADLYGHGRVVGSNNAQLGQCGDAAGVQLTYIGTAHYN